MLGRGISRSLAAMAMMAGMGSAKAAVVDSPSSRGRVRNPFLEQEPSRSERRKTRTFRGADIVTDVSGVSFRNVPYFTKPLQWLHSNEGGSVYREARSCAARGDGKRVQQIARRYYAMLLTK